MAPKPAGRWTAFMRGFWRGLGSPAYLFSDQRYPETVALDPPRLHKSIVDGIRSDWEQVGDDIRTVIGRETDPAAASAKRT